MQGLKWFRIDVIFDDKFELVCAEYGSKGFEVIVRLWQKIYASGYYIEWNEEVALLFAKKYSLGGGVVSEIVKSAVNRGLFDKDMLDRFGILTSRGIQAWYFDSVDRRKCIEIVKDYLLVDVTQKLRNVDIIWKNVSKNGKNVNISSIHTDIQTKKEIYKEKKQGNDEESTEQIGMSLPFSSLIAEESSLSEQAVTKSEIEEYFKKIYEIYPRKVSKARAQETFEHKLRGLSSEEGHKKAVQIYKLLKRQNEVWATENDGAGRKEEMLPYFSTWLNDNVENSPKFRRGKG